MSFKPFSASAIAFRVMSMMTGRTMRRSTLAIAGAMAAPLLAGCAISKDLKLDVQGEGLPANTAVSIRTTPADNELATRFAGALAGAFAEKGHALTEAAPVTAVFAFTRRNRRIGAAEEGPAAEGNAPAIKWISAPARRRAFQACKGERLRATLALYSRTANALVYRATGEIDGCEFSNADIDALAKALVEGAGRVRPSRVD
jgi:hypothetical protein